MTQEQVLNVVLGEKYAGLRLDVALSDLFPAFSRAFLQRCIKQGRLRREDGTAVRARDIVSGGEQMVFEPMQADYGPEDEIVGEDIPLTLVHKDDDMLVIDKPAGLVVHPGAGHTRGTLINALVFHFPQLKFLPRAGIVHRLDKDTSGLLTVAATCSAYTALVRQMQAHKIRREYLCLVQGEVIAGGRVDAPLGRHPRDRKRMAVVAGGRGAVTHYRVLNRFQGCTLLSVLLETGRTHQIRVHMAHIRHPVVGDAVYGGHRHALSNKAVLEALREFKRQALHATRLALKHPVTGEDCAWESELPADMRALMDLLSRHAAADV